MKSLIASAAILAASVVSYAIEVRDTSFSKYEIPATNPRIERTGDVITHVEVFGDFKFNEDGSATVKVADTSVNMTELEAEVWVKEAKKAVGLSVPRRYSKLKLIVSAKDAGRWEDIKTFIKQAGLEDEFLACQYFEDGNEQFVRGTNTVVSSGIATDEEVKRFLDLSVDTQ